MFPFIKTPNYLLREIRDSDAEGIYLLRSDPEVNRYLDRPRAQSVQDAIEFIRKISNNLTEKTSLYWIIQHTGRNDLSGTVCIWNITDRSAGELGFELLPGEQGKGIIKEVLPAVLDFGFRQLNLECIYGIVETGNLPSIKIMERFNFKRSDFEPGLLRFELGKREWMERSE
jgi:ribosomal-protein-alanine N-acetyltransferase